MHFYPNFEIFKIVSGLIICFGAFVSEFENKNVFITLWHFWWIFSSFQFSVFTENGNFQFFSKSFPQRLSLITHIIKLFQTVLIQTGLLKIC